MVGKRFGRLVVTAFSHNSPPLYITYWKCTCDCGTIKICNGPLLRSGQIVSCGCRGRENTSARRMKLEGKRFGSWTVLSYAGNAMYLCQCECGLQKEVARRSLGVCSSSCGCSRFTNLTGKTFGRWLVVGAGVIDGDAYGRGRIYCCVCVCGTERSLRADSLLSGDSSSCGCLCAQLSSIRERTHGHTANNTRTPIYRSWEAMRRRCCNHNAHNYGDYGGRGIRVCQRWLDSFENFLADMGPRPEGTTLNRIDNDGNYEPDNCEWATPKVQSNNRRRAKKRRLRVAA